MATNTSVHSERQHARHAVRTTCVVIAEDGERLLGETALDLSWDGARVECRVPATIGERVRVKLKIPRSTIWIDAGGYVARVLPGRRRGEAPPSIGVRLNRMDGMMRLLLGTTLRHRPRVEPTVRGPARDYAEVVRRISETG